MGSRNSLPFQLATTALAQVEHPHTCSDRRRNIVHHFQSVGLQSPNVTVPLASQRRCRPGSRIRHPRGGRRIFPRSATNAAIRTE